MGVGVFVTGLSQISSFLSFYLTDKIITGTKHNDWNKTIRFRKAGDHNSLNLLVFYIMMVMKNMHTSTQNEICIRTFKPIAYEALSLLISYFSGTTPL